MFKVIKKFLGTILVVAILGFITLVVLSIVPSTGGHTTTYKPIPDTTPAVCANGHKATVPDQAGTANPNPDSEAWTCDGIYIRWDATAHKFRPYPLKQPFCRFVGESGGVEYHQMSKQGSCQSGLLITPDRSVTDIGLCYEIYREPYCDTAD